ncbi:hypothetical protein AVEN_135703-1 [Araneus ventricosus]|uniref:Uncharacterized protein n=1 Tax=Araneus ventricosus TaxID=182803 RepID=A0A4Y2EW99_ARAVE|nr:hypothetical protein AVEN_135703-1 [Araneus ventricosus]
MFWKSQKFRVLFSNIVPEIFFSSSNDFRKHFGDRACLFGSFFSEFFDTEDTETIRVVFGNVDVEDRVRLVSGRCFFEHFVFSSRKDNWHLAVMCLREATLFKEDREMLQKTFMRFLPETEDVDIFLRKVKWEGFFERFDVSDANAPNKGRPELQTLTSNKICSTEFY